MKGFLIYNVLISWDLDFAGFLIFKNFIDKLDIF